MKPIIKKVTITDYRSIESDSIELSNVSVLVGANESGKTNLLRAINLIKPPIDPNNVEDIFVINKEKDTRMLSNSFTSQQFPTLEYEIEGITRLINEQYLKTFIETNQINDAVITRHGNKPEDFSIELSIKSPPHVIENLTGENLELTAEGKDTIVIPPSSWRIADEFPLYQVSIEELGLAGTLKYYDPSSSREFLKEKIKTEILSNLKVFFWTYEEKQIIQDVVPIAEFITNPETFPRINDLFKLGGWDKNKITNFLQNQSNSAYNNMLRKLSKDVTEIIKKSWRQNPNLNIEITHGDTVLHVLIRDNDYGTEYTQRSEGLKWFLSFLIGFRAQTDKFQDYLILFDEPGLHLHPGGQKDILKQVNLLAENNQIVYSTHSIFTLDKRFPERVKLISKIYDKDKYPLTKIKNSIDEIDILSDALLREVLGYSITDVSPISDINLLVEGVFDRNLIQESSIKYYTEYGDGINLNDVAIIACHSASNISKTAIHLVSNSLQCLCLYDSDQAGKSSSAANTAVNTTCKLLVGDIIPDAIEIEDIYPPTLFKEKFKEFFVKEYPTTTEQQSKILDIALVEKATTEGRDKEEIKHEFESILIDGISSYFNDHHFNDDSELKNVKDLIEKISKSLTQLSKKTQKV